MALCVKARRQPWRHVDNVPVIETWSCFFWQLAVNARHLLIDVFGARALAITIPFIKDSALW